MIQLDWLIRPIHQQVPRQRSVMILPAARIETPVLANPKPRVPIPLHRVIPPARAWRRHLQNQVRRLAHILYHIPVLDIHYHIRVHPLREHDVRNEQVRARPRLSAQIPLRPHQNILPSLEEILDDEENQRDQRYLLHGFRFPRRVGQPRQLIARLRTQPRRRRMNRQLRYHISPPTQSPKKSLPSHPIITARHPGCPPAPKRR